MAYFAVWYQTHFGDGLRELSEQESEVDDDAGLFLDTTGDDLDVTFTAVANFLIGERDLLAGKAFDFVRISGDFASCAN